MKFILPLTLLGLLLSACQSHQTDSGLRSKVADLEYRINLLEQQLAAKERTLPTERNSRPSVPYDANNNGSYGSGSSSGREYTGTTRSTYSPRCQAITKKGTQCKRNASKGSYCWQHGR